MITKKSSLVFFLFVIFQSVFSQEIAIPYRYGNLWGICNETGKILVEPKFDKLEFPNTSENSNDYMISKLNGLEGLIINGKEILTPKYTSIYDDNGLFHVKSTENESRADILLPNGTSIFEKPLAKILYQTKIEKNKKLFHVLNQNLTESVFILDMDNYKTVQVLYENYYSISYIRTRSDIVNRNEMLFVLKKSAKSDLLAERWSGTKIPLDKVSSDFRYLKEEEYLQFFASKYYGSSDDGYASNWGNGSKGEPMEVVEYSGSADMVEEAPMAIPYDERMVVSESPENKIKNLNHNLVKKDNKLFIESYSNRDYKNKKIEEIIVDVPVSDVKLPYGSFTFKTENGSDNYNNFIRYQKKGKTIIILPNDLKNKITFDFIDERNFPVKENNTIKEIVFLVGKKDKNNQLKYGLYSNVRKQIVDFIYDEFKNIQFYFNDGKMLFKIKQNDKYGLIQTDGTILLPTNFNDLTEVNNNYRSGTKVFQVQNDNKYGLIFLTSSEVKIIAPVFDYPIKGVIAKYPEFKNHNLHKNINAVKTISLIELKDESGQFMGYATFDGTQFFKD